MRPPGWFLVEEILDLVESFLCHIASFITRSTHVEFLLSFMVVPSTI